MSIPAWKRSPRGPNPSPTGNGSGQVSVRGECGGGECRPAVAAVPALAVTGDRCQPLRREIEAPNALVVEIAEVQGAVGSDHLAVGIVHLRLGIAGHAGADERR